MREAELFHELNTAEKKLPAVFNYPYYHKPNSISLNAAEQVKNELLLGKVKHSFKRTGKMFGVLIVKNKQGVVGFLKAFSGKLDNDFWPSGYVPPVYNVHQKDSFFKKEEKELDQMTKKINNLEKESLFLNTKAKVVALNEELSFFLLREKTRIKSKKKERKRKREQSKSELSIAGYEKMNRALNEQSKHEQMLFKKQKKELQNKLTRAQNKLNILSTEISLKKKERAERSRSLQKQLFKQYNFLNAHGEHKDLVSIFEETAFKHPPSGAGECCAPRLLQFAYQNNLWPLCFTEFWWGVAPESEIRTHNQHYPACRGKCEPILSHMLKGVSVEKSPLNKSLKEFALAILYEDENLLAVDKPNNMLSVPGKELKDSVVERVKKDHPHISGPGLIHRLDYETSGVLLIAKNKEAHRFIQKQFIDRSIKKKYVAILEKPLFQKSGEILLPLRMDPFDRPRQLVCFKEGKPSKTTFRLILKKESCTRVAFFPETGRTHQLRVHSAHKKGLNNPIMGDRLYGSTNDRLFLHAESITVVLPISNQKITITSPCPF